MGTETHEEVEIGGLDNVIPGGVGLGGWNARVPQWLGILLLYLSLEGWETGENLASSLLRRVGLELPSWASAGSRTLGSPRPEARQG